MLYFRHPKESEYNIVYDFYSELIETSPYTPNWEMGYFPDEETLREALSFGHLVLGELDGKPVSAAIVSYMAEYTVIELLGVLPAYTNKGFARAMVKNAFVIARLRGHDRVRLDVLEGNTAAETLYVSMGFEFLHSYEVCYERTGRMIFKVYEYNFKK